MTDGPLTHIARPTLPWRDPGLTICGRLISQYVEGLVIGLADAHVAIRRLGKQRFAMTHCMTCARNVDRWATWEEDPCARLGREMGHVGMTKTDPIIDHEIRAIGLLVEAHRAEFDDLVASFSSGDVVAMSSARRARMEHQSR